MSRILLARNRRDHQGLGSCLSRLGLLGAIDEFHDTSVDTEGFPAHAHDGSVSANSPYATAIARAV